MRWTGRRRGADADTRCGGGRGGAQQYQSHDPSREAIELAYEAILGQDMKARQKYGFRPPTTGRKTDLAGDELVGLPAPCPGPVPVPAPLRCP